MESSTFKVRRHWSARRLRHQYVQVLEELVAIAAAELGIPRPAIARIEVDIMLPVAGRRALALAFVRVTFSPALQFPNPSR